MGEIKNKQVRLPANERLGHRFFRIEIIRVLINHQFRPTRRHDYFKGVVKIIVAINVDQCIETV